MLLKMGGLPGDQCTCALLAQHRVRLPITEPLPAIDDSRPFINRATSHGSQPWGISQQSVTGNQPRPAL